MFVYLYILKKLFEYLWYLSLDRYNKRNISYLKIERDNILFRMTKFWWTRIRERTKGLLISTFYLNLKCIRS